MKLTYEKPEIELFDFQVLDNITGSVDMGGGNLGGGGDVVGGSGWGDED